MTKRVDEDDGRRKLIPRSPRLRVQSANRTDASSTVLKTVIPREPSLESTSTQTTGAFTPLSTLDGTSCPNTPETAERQRTLEKGVEGLSLSSSAPSSPGKVDAFARSKSETAFDTPEPGDSAESPCQNIRTSSISSADTPLPSVEVEEPATAEDHTLSTPGAEFELADRIIDDDPLYQPVESPTPQPRKGDRHGSLTSVFSDPSLLSPTREGSTAFSQRSKDRRPSDEPQRPVTVRDLPNATPRPSPSPRLGFRDSISSPSPNFTLDSLLVKRDDTFNHSLLENLKGLCLSQRRDGIADSEEDIDDEESNNYFAFHYDVTKEKLPASPFASASFQASLKRGVDLARDIFLCLDNCALATQSGTQLHRLYQTAKNLQEFNSPAERKIGIIGDSGAGKSSLINSLLHEPDLAQQGDAGSAVTTFVTEYRKRKPNQNAPFLIRVECYSKESMGGRIEELLEVFRAPYDPRTLQRPEKASDEYQDLKRKSNVAYSTLKSLFGTHNVFTKELLLGRPDPPLQADDELGLFEPIREQLQSLAAMIEWPQGTESGEWEETAQEAKECSQKLVPFMENSFWPLINTVKIHLSSQILKTGIILVDLPGLRDSNPARLEKMERYQHECDEIFIVANIKRVVSDESVKRLISVNVFESPKADLCVSIICTHADDIDIFDAETNKKFGDVIDAGQKTAAKRAKDKAIKSNRSDDREITTLRYNNLFIQARNQIVKKSVLEAYGTTVSNSQLRVFCVGNRYYFNQEIEYPEGRAFAIANSGIPELRAHCHSAVAKAQFRASTHFLEADLPDLVHSLQWWMDATNREPQPGSSLKDLISNLETELMNQVEAFYKVIEGDFETKILKLWRDRQASFDKCAIDASRDWDSFTYNQYYAFCFHDGNYATPKICPRRWNDELLRQMNQDLKDPWQRVEENIDHQFDHVKNALSHAISSVRESLKAGNQVWQALQPSIRLKERALTSLLTEKRYSLLENFRTIQLHATTDCNDSYIRTIMAPVYKACIQVPGGEKYKNMREKVAEKMQRRDIFAYMRNRVSTEMDFAYRQTVEKINFDIQQMCSYIESQLQMTGGAESESSRLSPGDSERLKRMLSSAAERHQRLLDYAAPALLEAKDMLWI